MTPPTRLLAFAVPVFNEHQVLPELLARIAVVRERLAPRACLVFVADDGSTDSTPELLTEAAARHDWLRPVLLSRNFGHQAALTAAVDAARACSPDALITLDGDLQDPPELALELVKAWEAGAKVVVARRRSRQDTGLRRLGMDAFHRVFRRISDFPLDPDSGTFGLVDREAMDALSLLPERHRFFPGLRAWVGFTRAEILYDRAARGAGQPKQTLHRLLHYAADAIFGFSYLPLRALTWLGLAACASGFATAAYFIFKRLLGHESAFTGFTTLVSLMLFLGGTQLAALGIVGEYIARIYDEVKRRPLYIVRSPPPTSVSTSA
jgi:polyisoprenyl-phosphate glycosyltransferase